MHRDLLAQCPGFTCTMPRTYLNDTHFIKSQIQIYRSECLRPGHVLSIMIMYVLGESVMKRNLLTSISQLCCGHITVSVAFAKSNGQCVLRQAQCDLAKPWLCSQEC